MKQGHKADFLGQDPMFPLLLKMGIPAAVGMIVNALYNIVDTIFVGQGVGPLAIAALSIVFPVQMIVSAIAQAIGVGTASIVSRKLGEKNHERVVEAVGTAYTAVSAVTFFLVLILFVFTEPILRFFGASDATLPYALSYTRIVGAGFFFFAMSMLMSNIMRAEGNPKVAMTSMLLGAGMNTILDPLFIFVLKMGVEGAAIATVISQMCSTGFLLSVYLRKKSHLHLERRHFRPRLVLFGESAILGLPAFIQSAGMSLLALLVNTSLGRLGGDTAISTYGMNHKTIMIVIFPILGIVQGFQPIAGYNFGAKNYHRVRQSLVVTGMTAFGASLVGYALMMFTPGFLVRLFTRDEALIASSARALRLMTLMVPLASLQIMGAAYFQAVGHRMQSLLLGLSRQFIFLIPLIFLLSAMYGVDGVWLSYPIADFFSSLLTGTLLMRELKKLGRS